MAREGSERRRQPRFIVGRRARARGRVTSLYEASLLNINTSGALIEHTEVVSPGTISFLELDLQGRKVSLKCRVAWSVVHRVEVHGGGERAAVYHTGLEFLKPSDETRRVISEYIRSIAEKRQGADRRITRRSYICDKCGESFVLVDSEVHPVSMQPRKRPVKPGDLFAFDHGTCRGTLKYIFGGPFVPWTASVTEPSSD